MLFSGLERRNKFWFMILSSVGRFFVFFFCYLFLFFRLQFFFFVSSFVCCSQVPKNPLIGSFVVDEGVRVEGSRFPGLRVSNLKV